MLELFHNAFSPPNLIPTTLLFLCIVYGIMVILGALDANFLDFDVDADLDIDLDVDMDMDVDADIDADTDIDANSSGSSFGLASILKFFNIGQVPFMIYLSILSLFLWPFSILLNYSIQNTSFALGLILLVPNLIASLFLTKIVSTPLAKSFSKMNKGHKDEDLIGKAGTVVLTISGQKMGQVEYVGEKGDFLLLNAKTKEGIHIKKDSKVEFIEKKDGYYMVVPYE